MEAVALKFMEAAVLRTIHAHGFSRSSSQASFVLTDLMARYLALLTSACAKYSQHAGRECLTAQDALLGFAEMGVSSEELSEYCGSEGNELRRYAVYSARRVEDLNELKAQLASGLRQDRDDFIPLVYAAVEDLPDVSDEEEYDEEDEDVSLDVDMEDLSILRPSPFPERKELLPPCSTPPLPLSPVSNPSSPSRKRQRTNDWKPPPHIPDFLPPFPTAYDSSDSPALPESSPNPAVPPLAAKSERHASPLAHSQPLASSSSSSSDYLIAVPYAQSSLAGIPEWHLPSSVPPEPPLHLQPRVSRLSTPQTQPALLQAYHHILTHPPPPHVSAPTPSRHKVAMALLTLMQNNPRWEPPDTLYSSIAPCPPRVAPIGPSYPVPDENLMPPPSEGKGGKDEEKEKERSALPSAPSRPISSYERPTLIISQQGSRIPDLARQVLSGSVHRRTTRLGHPPVLQRGSEKLTYGPGVPAPWNAGSTGTATPTVGISTPNGQPSEKPVAAKVLPDAHLYATWDYEQKRFNEPLTVGRRGRMGSIQGSNAVALSLGLTGRNKTDGKG